MEFYTDAAQKLGHTAQTHYIPLAELSFYLKVLHFKRVTRQVKGKVVPTHVMKAYRRSGSIDPIILNLGAR
jgi:hypothetical protein